MKFRLLIKIFWLPLLLIVLIGVDCAIVKYLHLKVTKIRGLNEYFTQEFKKDKAQLSILKNRVGNKENNFNVWFKTFETEMEAKAFLLNYSTSRIKSLGGRLIGCKFSSFSSKKSAFATKDRESDFKIIPIVLKASFGKYSNVLKMLDFFENTPPLLIVNKVIIQKTGMKLNVEVQSEFPYHLVNANHD
ncbi:MAG: hypothetical protein LWW94_05790 [Candidatus Desulfofervidaceae bacterium]|nr:hypothetical protein [Candidatus Desulfofervidaceae bacterium]